MSYKKMGIAMLSMSLAMLFIFGSITFVFDPFIHYHEPYKGINYTLNRDNERYANDGITRNLQYNAIITGTSMTENFKTSEFDKIFQVNSIKIPFSGAKYKELNDALSKAIDYNPNIETIIRSLDLYNLFSDKNQTAYENLPEYLYDDSIFNDTDYLFNKETFLLYTLPNIIYTARKKPSTNFDDYANWMTNWKFGKDAVLERYPRKEKANNIVTFTEEEKQQVMENVKQNITDLADANPNIDFYYFLPPYSIVYYDSLYVSGELERLLDAWEYAIEIILEHENIHLYSFLTDYETICNLDNYKDTTHYHEDINSKMLIHMKNEEYLLTKDNCDEYFENVREFYLNYPYDTLFE